MEFIPLKEAEKSQPSLTFVPLKEVAPKAEVKAQTPVAEAPIVTSTTAPKPDANIDPTTGKPYPELRALPEPSVWDKLWAFATRNETLDNKAKAANEYAARKYAAENKVPLSTAYKITKDAHRPVFNPEGRDSTTAAVQSAAAAAKSLPDMPEAALNTTLRAIAGGDVPVKNRTWLDRAINYTTPPKRKGDPNVEAFANVGQSLGYSVTTMVSAAVTNAVAGPYAAGAVGVAVPYRASKNEFLTRLRDNLDEQSEKLYGKPLSEKDWNKAREEFDSAASRYGAWEAVPEAASNLIMLKAFTAPLKTVNSAERLAEITKRGLVSQVSEQGTETITALGQNKEELRAGLTKEELSVADAFRQQFVQTLITTGTLAGGAKGVQQVNKFYENYVEPKVRPGSALARAIQADLNTYLEQQPAKAAQYTFVPLAPISTPAEPEPPRPELKDLQAARKPELETEAPPDRTLSALEKARNEGIEVEAPPGPTLSAMERARNEGIEGAPVAPPIEEQVVARAIEYERQGYMQDDARLLAERDVAAEMRQDVGGRAVQRQDIEDERRTAEGRAERAAMSMEAPSELPEPPSYVTEPSADEYGAAVPSGAAGAARGPVSAFDRGLDIARSTTGELDARERAERASLDANKRRIESDISRAFARDAFPDLGVTLGASWVRSTLAKNPTPEEYQDAAYARLEELDGQRPDDAGPAFERTAAPAPAETKAEAKPTETVEERYAREEAEYTAQEAAQEKRKARIREVVKANVDSAIDQAGEYKDVNEAADAYRENVFDTLQEQGIKLDDYELRYADQQFDKILEERKRGTQAPKAVEAKEERQAEPAKGAAPTEFEPLALEAGRREDLEVEPSEIAEVKKAEQALTKAGTPRQRAPGAGRPKSETAKTAAERVAQSNALNKFNRDVALLIEKAKEFSERQAMETFQTPDEFEYKEALRDMRADQMRAVIYGLSQRTGSMAQGVIDAKGYIRSLPEALRNRAKALHEGTAKLSDYHEIPPKPEVLIERERKSAEYKKARAEGKAKKEALGKPLAARMRDAFKAWFGDSVVRNKDGSPKVMYHGTARDIHEFRAKQANAIFVTENPNFAYSFSQTSEGYMIREYARDNLSLEEHRALDKRAQEIAEENGTSADDEFYALIEGLLPSRANIMPVYVSAQNPFDYEKRTHLEALAEVIDNDAIMAEIARGSWSVIESKDVQSAIKAFGFDGFYVKEGRYKNLAVYEPTQIKSIFNPGTYSPTDPRILAAARREEQEELGLSEADIYRIEQQLDMRPDPTFKELTSLSGALAYIANSPNQLEAELAARLLQDDNIDMVGETSFQVVETDTTDVDPAAKEMLDDDAVGAYVPYTQGGSVFVRGSSYGADQGINNEIVLHEAMHAVGAKKIAFVELAEKNDAPVPARLAEAVHQLRDLMDRTRETYAKLLAAGTAPSNLERMAEAGAFTNIQEFYAYGMTDPDMKLFLRDTVPGTSTKTSGFDRFVEILMKLFGVDPKLKSGLKDLLLINNEIMQAKKPSDKALAELTRKENEEIVLKAKKQRSDEARVMRNLKAAKTAEEVVEQLGSLTTVAKNPDLWGKWLKRNYTNMAIPALRGYLYSMPTNVVIDAGTAAGIGGLKEIDREVRNMTTFQHGRMREVENITKEWSKIKAPMQKKMAAIMNAATDMQIDPDKDTSNKELNKMWAALTPDAQAVYRKARDFFKVSYNLYGAYLEQRIKNSGLKDEDKKNIMASLRAMHEAGAKIAPYFPLMRHGEFWARFGKGEDVEFQMFDTPGDRDAYAEAKAGGKFALQVMASSGAAETGNNAAGLRERIAQQGGEISKIFDAIDSLASGTATQKEQLKDEIFQLHLLTLPEGSFRKQFIRRQGKAGYSADALRNFAVAGTRMANQLGKVKYGPVLKNRIDAARASLAGNPEKDRLDMFVDEMNERVQEQITPKYEEGWWPSFVRAANRFAFVYALTSAKSAVTNLFSLPIHTVPTMMKYFGIKDTMATVGKFMVTLPAQVGVTRVDAAGNVTYTAPSFGSSYMVRRDPELKRAIKAMEEMGITLSTQTYDLWLAKRGKVSTSKTRQFTEGVVRVTGALFQGSERMIREVAFLSAFKLARKTMDFDDAVMKAVDVVNESLYDYSAWNTPRIMRSNTAKLLTQFKKYALYTTIYYASNFAQMIKPLKGETRRGAAYAFFGSMGLAGLSAGITGMFGVSFTMQMYGVMQALWNMVFGGDDDEARKKMYELDFVRWFNNVYLPEEFGHIKVAGMGLDELLASGVINTATGYDFATSVSAGNLWFRDIPDAGQWEHALANFVEYMSGPAINITGTMFKGVKDIMEGDTKKGLEKLMPIGALRGPMSSWRMSEEGLVDRDLNKIKSADDFTNSMLFMQGLGYKTTGVTEVTNMNYYINKARRDIEDKRGKLVQQWVKNMRKGDNERVQDIQSNISKFNRMYPIEKLIIDGETLTTALDMKLDKAAMTNRGLEMQEKFMEFEKLRQPGLDKLINE